MYTQLHGLDKFGRKVIRVSDDISEFAQRVSGAVKGAAVGARTAPAHPYLVPAIVSAGVFLALKLASQK